MVNTPFTWPVILTQYVPSCAFSSCAKIESVLVLLWRKDSKIWSWLLQQCSEAVERRGMLQKICLILRDNILLATKFQHDLKICRVHEISVRWVDQGENCKRNARSFAISKEALQGQQYVQIHAALAVVLQTNFAFSYKTCQQVRNVPLSRKICLILRD